MIATTTTPTPAATKSIDDAPDEVAPASASGHATTGATTAKSVRCVQLHDSVVSLYVHPLESHACVAVFHHRHSFGPEHVVVRCAARLACARRMLRQSAARRAAEHAVMAPTRPVGGERRADVVVCGAPVRPRRGDQTRVACGGQPGAPRCVVLCVATVVPV